MGVPYVVHRISARSRGDDTPQDLQSSAREERDAVCELHDWIRARVDEVHCVDDVVDRCRVPPPHSAVLLIPGKVTQSRVLDLLVLVGDDEDPRGFTGT